MGVGGDGPVARNDTTRVNSSSRTDVSVIHKVQIKPFNASSIEEVVLQKSYTKYKWSSNYI